ncbi:hypothetical protein ACS0TY_013007 [Phlomoides rotata]
MMQACAHPGGRGVARFLEVMWLDLAHEMTTKIHGVLRHFIVFFTLFREYFEHIIFMYS